MDATDRELCTQMIRLHTDNLDALRAEGDADYADIMYCLDRLAWWSRKLHSMTFGQVAGCAR